VRRRASVSHLKVSLPRRYVDQLDGLSPPDASSHEFSLQLEPNLGAPVQAKIRFQLNIMVQPDKAYPPMANLTQPLTVLPILWAEEGYDEWEDLCLMVVLAVPYAASVMLVICLAIGAGLLLSFACGAFKRRQTPFKPRVYYVEVSQETSDCNKCRNVP